MLLHQSKIAVESHDALVDVALSVRKLGDCLIDDLLERVLPDVVELFKLLVAADAVLLEAGDEVLAGFSILLGLQSLVLDGLLAVFFAFLVVAGVAGDGREDCWRAQDFVEVLKLLTGALLVCVCHWPVVYLYHIREPVDNECPKKNGVRDFIFLDGKTHQRC